MLRSYRLRTYILEVRCGTSAVVVEIGETARTTEGDEVEVVVPVEFL
jgi:hypothetical protein